MAGGGGGGSDIGGGKLPGDKKRRSAARHVPEEDPEFQIAPMIDVLLVLLTFFMTITTADIIASKKEVQLPKSSAGESPKKGGEAIINITSSGIGDGNIFLGDVPVKNVEELFARLVPEVEAAAKDGGKGAFRVRLRVDGKVKYSFLSEVMRACGQAGVATFNIAVSKQGV